MLASIFSVIPLGLEEWWAVVWISFPVIVIDEILKGISRNYHSIPIKKYEKIKQIF